MKAFTQTLKQLIVVLCLSTSFVSASTLKSQTEETRIGERTVSIEKKLALEEQYAQEGEEDIQVSEKYGRDPFYPLDYSKFSIKEIGVRGQTITMGDESVWIIKPADGYKVANWSDEYSARTTGYAPTDVYITTNDNWFFDRQYDYRMVNIATGEYVYCNITTGPANHCKTWILNIDAGQGIVELTNIYGNYVILYLSPSDFPSYCDWERNDMVIFGRNLRWGSLNNPYLLINLITETTARCEL